MALLFLLFSPPPLLSSSFTSRSRLSLHSRPPSRTTIQKPSSTYDSTHLPSAFRRPSVLVHSRLRRPGVTAEATQSMHAFDLMPKERLMSTNGTKCHDVTFILSVLNELKDKTALYCTLYAIQRPVKYSAAYYKAKGTTKSRTIYSIYCCGAPVSTDCVGVCRSTGGGNAYDVICASTPPSHATRTCIHSRAGLRQTGHSIILDAQSRQAHWWPHGTAACDLGLAKQTMQVV